MVEDLTVLLVGDDEPDEKLVEQLEKKNLNVEISAQAELGSLLALVEPHIVVHIGKAGAEATVNLLKETEEVRRVRLILLAEREAHADLRKLDRTVVVSLLASDIAPSVVAARVLMLAKKGPEKSLRPPSALAKPPPKAAHPPLGAAGGRPPSPKPPERVETSVVPPRAPVPTPATAPTSRFGLASAVTLPPVPTPPRSDSLQMKPATSTILGVGVSRAKSRIPEPSEAVAPAPAKSSAGPSPDSGRATSDFPTMAIDLSIPTAARPEEAGARVVLADDDVTRADLIACALREANVPTRIVPLDAAKTHWPLVREFAPTVVMVDDHALKTTGQVWLQLFQADQALRRAKLVAVPFERLCKVDEGSVSLRTLIPQIPQLSGQLEVSGRPTSGPALPKEPISSPSHPSPAVEAPVPFEDDDPDEFERLTVARPIDAPLPTEATRSNLPDQAPMPAAGIPAAPLRNGGIDEDGPRPVFDSLAPAPDLKDKRRSGIVPSSPTLGTPESDTPKTPAATETSADPPAGKSGGGKFLLVAMMLLVLGALGGWFAFGRKLPQFLGLSPPTSASAPKAPHKTPDPPTIQEIPESPPPDANAPSPEQLLWRASSTPAPNCDELVKNLEELKVGGVKQAAVSLGKARQSMVLGRLDDALTLLCEAVLVHPESLALEELAALYLTKGSPEQALEWHQKAAALRPDRTRTLELGGDIHSQLGNVAEAKAAFVASLKVKPDDEKTLKAVSKHFSEQGNAEFRSGGFDAATLLYRRSATLDPTNAEALAGLSATSAAVGNAKAAGRWAEKTLLVDEGHHVALVVQAALATEAGDTEKARALTEKAIERNQNYLPAHQLREKLKGE